MEKISIPLSFELYVKSLSSNKSDNTIRTYTQSLQSFSKSLQKQDIDIDLLLTDQVSEDWIVSFLRSLSNCAPASKNRYFWGIYGWYRFLSTEGLAKVDLRKIKDIASPFIKRNDYKVVEPPNYYQIAKIIEYTLSLSSNGISNERARLRVLRDKALIMTIAETGLDITNICELKRGNIDWRNNRIIVLDRRRQKIYISISPKLKEILLEYLNARLPLDKATSHSQATLPLFAGHGLGINATNKATPIQTRIVGSIVKTIAIEALGAEYDSNITARTLRQYKTLPILNAISFLHTKIINNCQSLFESGRYDEAVFNSMKTIEEEIRKRVSADSTDLGVNLITKAMQNKPTQITFSSIPAEQEAIYYLFRGAIGNFKNPLSHRFVNITNPIEAFEIITFASLLLRMLDQAES